MDTIVRVNLDLCIGCDKCVENCPVEGANIVYQDDSGIKIRIDETKCAVCGRCVGVCPTDARYYG